MSNGLSAHSPLRQLRHCCSPACFKHLNTHVNPGTFLLLAKPLAEPPLHIPRSEALSSPLPSAYSGSLVPHLSRERQFIEFCPCFAPRGAMFAQDAQKPLTVCRLNEMYHLVY